MKWTLLIFIAVMVTSLLSTTLIVNMGGGGEFTSIQTAINTSANGDTVLVYPGIYYENINYSGKNITITSKELLTNNPAYRDSTIIDGNHSGSCVTVVNYENNACIYGFTITHGSGWAHEQNGAIITIGGGFLIRYATNFRISNCCIIENRASDGGGIYISEGTMQMKDTMIVHNYAAGSGGGMIFTMNSNCIFDNNQRCSIYENNAGDMNDIGASDVGGVINIVLNTFTVNPPTAYYANYVYLFSGGAGYFTYDILNAYRSEINHDLYVSPSGNDLNSGLTSDNPLKSITKALHTIASDSLYQKTIHLASGIYSSEDGQLFPLSMKAHVKLLGDSLSYPIILNQRYEETLVGGHAPGMDIKNMIFEHGNYHPIFVFTLLHCSNTKITNITINPVQAISTAGMLLYDGKYDITNIVLNGLTSNCLSGINFYVAYGSAKNITINDCHETGNDDLPVFGLISASLDSSLVFENITLTNSSIVSPTVALIMINTNQLQNPYLRITNLLAANNTSTAYSPFSISMNSIYTSAITNCTFSNNVGGASILRLSGRMNVSNCIIDNGGYSEVNIRNTQAAGYTSNINFDNNLIAGYPNSVYYHSSNNVTFNAANFNAEPMFSGIDPTDPMSYRLNNGSPCIDAGTPDTTGLYLPEEDLYGNPRIFNGIVDIGCNEWDGTPIQNNENLPIIDSITLEISPNPFRSFTNIRYNLAKAGNVSIEVYNVKGQKLKTLLDTNQSKGEHSYYWNGENDNGKPSGAGIYIIKATTELHSLSRKIFLVK